MTAYFMPELPEVETIRRGLETHIVGCTIEDIEIRLAKQFAGDPQLVIGSKIIAVRRFGKGLVIDLDNSYSIVIHLKMTGQLVVSRRLLTIGEDKYPNKWTHVIFKIKDQKLNIKNTNQRLKINDPFSFLYYNDIRQFGWIKIVKADEVNNLPFFKSLGLEPLKDLTIIRFGKMVKCFRSPIKSLLMDQGKIAGIGNIYANDALFAAKIHPNRQAQLLTQAEIKKLFKAIEGVLKKGIETGGASEWNYLNVLGEKGGYQNFFQVYNREGEKCKHCSSLIERIKMGGRGTFYCPVCQR